MRAGKRWTQLAWALNGWGNHAYATSVLVALFPIFLDKYWAVGVDGTTSTGWLGLANGGASAAVMVLAPVLGALADRRAWKKRLLAAFTLLGALATALLALVDKGGYAIALPLFAVASIGFFTSWSFFDALLVQVASPAESDRVSAFGFALGYLGGGVIFLIDVLMVLHPAWFGLADAVTATRVAFVSVALWWVVFTLPLLIWVPEGAPTREATGWRELRNTARAILRQRSLRLFLIAYWIYMDALGTLQQMAADFGAKMGFPSDALIKALLMVQFVSFPAALGFGWLAGRIGTRRAIYLGLLGLVGVSLWSYFLHTVTQFYWMAGVVGLVQGGVQALSRSYFSRLIPAEKAGEYFGFYNFLGKFAAVIGPFVVGAIAVFSGDQRLSLAPLALAFVLGAWLLSRVCEQGPGLEVEHNE